LAQEIVPLIVKLFGFASSPQSSKVQLVASHSQTPVCSACFA